MGIQCAWAQAQESQGAEYQATETERMEDFPQLHQYCQSNEWGIPFAHLHFPIFPNIQIHFEGKCAGRMEGYIQSERCNVKNYL